MITWEEFILEDGMAAEFPMDLLRPSDTSKKVFYWDQEKEEAVQVDNKEHIMTVPLYEVLNENAKQIMESALDDSFYYQGGEVISGNKRGLGVFESYKRRNK